jgi:predicted peptidase
VTSTRLCRRWLELLLAASVVALAVQVGWPTIDQWRRRPRPGTQTLQSWRSNLAGAHSINADYWLYLPADYGASSEQWPLVVYLHGAGERGRRTDRVKIYGLPFDLDRGRQFPAIVATPQCRRDSSWRPEDLAALTDHLEDRFVVDSNRIYMMGYSMGGFGVWEFAGRFPQRIAAIVSFAGAAVPQTSPRIAGVAAWAIHGEQDDVVDSKVSRDAIEKLRGTGGIGHLTLLPDRDHGIPNFLNENPEIIDWLLRQSKGRSRANVAIEK